MMRFCRTPPPSGGVGSTREDCDAGGSAVTAVFGVDGASRREGAKGEAPRARESWLSIAID